MMDTKYRSASSSNNQPISSDEGEIHSDSDSDDGGPIWSNKRAKGTDSLLNKPALPQAVSQKPARTKNANVWGAVLLEQSSTDISSSFGAVGMQYRVSRGPESFDLPKESKESSSSGSEEESKPAKTITHIKKGKNKNNRKRKKPRCKSSVPSYEPGKSITLNKRCELSDTDPVDKVAEEIAFRLWERKRSLIRSLTEVLGVAKAIDFCNKTESIEKSGGLMVMKGTRRRTPGGTFLYLVRNDPKVDQDPIKKVFELENERERLMWELKRTAKTDHCDDMEIKEATNPSHEVSSVEMSLSNDHTSKELTDIAVNPSNKTSDGEMQNRDEEVDTFG